MDDIQLNPGHVSCCVAESGLYSNLSLEQVAPLLTCNVLLLLYFVGWVPYYSNFQILCGISLVLHPWNFSGSFECFLRRKLRDLFRWATRCPLTEEKLAKRRNSLARCLFEVGSLYKCCSLYSCPSISVMGGRGEFQSQCEKKDLVSLTLCMAKSLLPVLYVCTGITQGMQEVLGL